MVYRLSTQALLRLPVYVREATPELVELIEQQLSRITSSTRTGEFAPDDLEAAIKVDREGVIEVETEELEHLVLTDG